MKARHDNASIHVSIDRLSLHGFHPHDARRMVQALEAELTRLARETVWNAPPGEPEARGPVPYTPSIDPELTGRAAARALWSRVTGLERETS